MAHADSGSGSSGRSARSPSRRCAPRPTSPPPSSSTIRTVPDVLDAVDVRRGRLRGRADRELDRGRRQLHPGRPGLRLRPADHARDRARHRALPRRRRRAGARRRQGGRCRSRSPPRSATASCASSCRGAEVRTRPVDGRAPPSSSPRRRRRPSRHWRRSPRGSPPSATGSTCSPTTSPTTPATRPASSSSPATGIPAPTGHDRTAMVVYQRADEPGSLISILQEFAARRINLSNLLSRPTKDGGLGDYCFVDLRRRPHRRRAAGRHDAGPARQAGRGEVPRLVPGRRRRPTRTAASTPTPAGTPPRTGSPASRR